MAAKEELADDLQGLSISPYGEARSTYSEKPLSEEELRKTNDYFMATMYLCLGMIYLKENPLLREPLSLDHIKHRLLGHWGDKPSPRLLS
jgi:xylulose-5-phosphate/fructose-6-phosphate phosphoketolase